MAKFAVTVLSLVVCLIVISPGCNGQDLNLTTIQVHPDPCTTGAGYLSQVNVTVTSLTPVSLTSGTAPYTLTVGQVYTVVLSFISDSTQNNTDNGRFQLTAEQSIELTFWGHILGAFLPIPSTATVPLVDMPVSTVLISGAIKTVTIIFTVPSDSPSSIFSIFNPFLYTLGEITVTATFIDQITNIAWCRQGETELVTTPIPT